MKRVGILVAMATVVGLVACGDDGGGDAEPGDTGISTDTSVRMDGDVGVPDGSADGSADGSPDGTMGDGSAGDASPDGTTMDSSTTTCVFDSDCDDGYFCDGVERCFPGDPTADPRGCVGPETLPCAAGQGCNDTTDECVSICTGAEPAPSGGGGSSSCVTDDDCKTYCRGSDARCRPGHPDADSFGCTDVTSPCREGVCDEARGECCDPVRGCCGNECAMTLGTPCSQDSHCQDGLFCTGRDICDPTDPDADSRGCRSISTSGQQVCLIGTTCDETSNCCRPSGGGACSTGFFCGLGGDVDMRDHDRDGILAVVCGGSDSCDDPWIQDRDGDGHNSISCGGDDCDDSDPNRYPGNAEICDVADHDEDCDPTTFGNRDTDGDGYYDDRCCNSSGATMYCGDDCNDSRRATNPGMGEVCNSIDDDCDTATDEGVLVTLYRDEDMDNAGNPVCPRMVCPGTAGFAMTAGDCNDGSDIIGPGDSVCGADRTVLLTCTGGSFIESDCPAGTWCYMEPPGVGRCR